MKLRIYIPLLSMKKKNGQHLILSLFLLLSILQLNAQSGSWNPISYSGDTPKERHESAFVQAGDKFFLIGGRGLDRIVQEFDINTNTWTNRAAPPNDPSTGNPVELHHMQLVTLDGMIYILGAFTGNFPTESPVNVVILFDPLTYSWHLGPTIPPTRLRGSTGAVVHNGKIYMVCGITNGHINGWVNWMDEYDPATNTWTQLANAPRARDHFHAEVYNGKIYVAGGRQTGSGINVFAGTIDEVDVYDIATNSWATLPSATGNIPTPRAGTFSSYLSHSTLGDILVVAGGESNAQTTAHTEVEALDLTTNQWLAGSTLPSLPVARHGTQIIRSNGGLYIAAGAGPNRGGNPEVQPTDAHFLSCYHAGAVQPPTGTALIKGDMDPAAGSEQLEFGMIPVGNTANLTAQIENNNGTQGILISAIALTGGDSAQFAVNLPLTLPLVIPPGGSLDIPLSFTPTTTNPVATSLVIAHTGSSTSTTIPLSGGNGSPAPVELLHFSGKLQGSHVQLSWETAQEVNSAYFGIERSADGQLFEEIQQINAQGNSPEPVLYSAIDDTPLVSKNIYRLKMVDLDGSFEYSSSIEVDIPHASVTVFPNPLMSGQILNISGRFPDRKQLYVKLSGILGKEYFNQQVDIRDGLLHESVLLPELAKGLYLLSIRDAMGYLIHSVPIQIQ